MNKAQQNELAKIMKEVKPFTFTSETRKGGMIHLAQDNYSDLRKNFNKVFNKMVNDGYGNVTFRSNNLHIEIKSPDWYLPFGDYIKYYPLKDDLKFHVMDVIFSIKKKTLGSYRIYKRINRGKLN